MTDQELIAEGRLLVARIATDQLKLGRLALDYAPIGDASVKTGAYTRLREYADAIGADEGTLRNHRAVAHAWLGLDAGPLGYTAMKALTSVAHKEELVQAIATVDPPTRSRRWTATAAVEFAKANGFWSHAGGSAHDDALALIQRTRTSLARLKTADLSYEEATNVIALLTEVRFEVEAIRDTLIGKTGAPA